MKTNLFDGFIQYKLLKSLPKFLSGLFPVVIFQKAVGLETNNKSNELLFKIGKAYGKVISLKALETIKSNAKLEFIKTLLKELEYSGLGKTDIKKFNPDAGIVVISNSNNPWARQFRKSFDTQNEPVDFFLAGLYSGIVSPALGKDIFFKETMCLAKNDRFCIFESSPEPHLAGNFSQDEIDKAIKWENIYSAVESKQPQDLIQKIVHLGHMKIAEGELKVWNIYCIFLALNLIQITQVFLKKAGFDVSSTLKYIGLTQSKIAARFQMDQFGVKPGIPTFNALLPQVELFGMGRSNAIKVEEDEIVVLNEDNFSVLQHRNMFKDEFEDGYFFGMLAGICKYSFNKNISSIRREPADKDYKYTFCFSNENKSYCITEEFKKMIKNKESIPLIQEKMKHVYYLS